VSDPPVASDDAEPAVSETAPESATRAERWVARRARARRISLIAAVTLVVGGAVIGTVVVVTGGNNGSASAASSKLISDHPTTTKHTTTTRATTTTSTIPAIHQPKVVKLPDVPPNGLSWGDSGPVVAAYQQRLKNLHFDPGAIDGVFGQDTEYAVTAVEKLYNLGRDGRIGPLVQLALEHFKYKPAAPTNEPDRVEINLDNQVLTVYKNWQPILITTTSTGSGEHFCGGTDGCQYAITPTGHFHFQFLHNGWDNGKLGKMWNPYYFNGGIAVHGLASVPPYPASHGCARIPMHIANYFPSLVTKGESVYVVGTPMKAGNLYVGPYTPPTTTTTAPKTTTTKPGKGKTHGQSTTTVPHPPTTVKHGPTTTQPKTTTTH
jgi:peptidoglycan hydrolase-like protein with peptidoglycan-binding domain